MSGVKRRRRKRWGSIDILSGSAYSLPPSSLKGNPVFSLWPQHSSDSRVNARPMCVCAWVCVLMRSVFTFRILVIKTSQFGGLITPEETYTIGPGFSVSTAEAELLRWVYSSSVLIQEFLTYCPSISSKRFAFHCLDMWSTDVGLWNGWITINYWHS